MADGYVINTAVDSRELHEGRDEQYDRSTGKWQCTRAFLVPWIYRFDFIKDVCGYSRIFPGGAIFRGNPHQYPGLPGICLAKTASVKPAGRSYNNGYAGQEIGFTYAIVTVKYETPDFKINTNNNEAYFSESYDGSAQMISMAKGTYKFATTGNALDEHVGKQIGSVAINLEVKQWVGFVPGSLSPYYGRINTGEFRGFDEGKVLFLTTSAKRSYTPDGIEAFEVGLKFLYRDKKWNEFLNPKNGNWEELDPLPYESTDLSAIFPFLA